MAPDRDSSAEERAVLADEDAYVAAEVQRDEAALRRLVDEHFVAITPTARPPAEGR